MSSIVDRIATEHRSYGGMHCHCGHCPDKDEPINDARTRHIAAVTEQAVRDQIATQAAIRAALADPLAASEEQEEA